MDPPLPERTSVLIVRAWIERETEAGLRARITYTLDLSTRDEVVIAVATPKEVYTAVRAWLEAFTASGDANNAVSERRD